MHWLKPGLTTSHGRSWGHASRPASTTTTGTRHQTSTLTVPLVGYRAALLKDVLARQASESERRVRVLRIAATGEQPQRLVGMLIPEPAVDEVVAALSSRSGGAGGGEGGAAGQQAASAGKASEQAEGSGGAKEKAGGKGTTPRAPKAAGEAVSPKAGGHSGRRHHRRRHHRAAAARHEAEPGDGSEQGVASPKHKRRGRKAADAQGGASDRSGRSGNSGADVVSPKRKRRGRKADKGEASDRSGGGGSEEDAASPKRKRRQKEEQPRRMPHRSGRPASMKG